MRRATLYFRPAIRRGVSASQIRPDGIAPVAPLLYQVPKRPTLVPISQISRDLIQRCGGGFEMAAPISLRGDFDGPMLRALCFGGKGRERHQAPAFSRHDL